MTRDIISVQYPVIDETQSVCSAVVEQTAVTAANGITIEKAVANKNNTLMICIENTADSDTTVTLTAGDAYPNAMLGDLEVEVSASSLYAIQLQDISRFENKDGSVNIDFDSDFTGNIFAIAKSVDLNV
ncbi:MAG: hypothetical protein LUB59_05205 [Candidatus Gastranaerophilales bacterium]|nr:hypothetical protein [Candidatus Gastranaerophilales bacterium]